MVNTGRLTVSLVQEGVHSSRIAPVDQLTVYCKKSATKYKVAEVASHVHRSYRLHSVAMIKTFKFSVVH